MNNFPDRLSGLSNGGFVTTWYDYSGTLGDVDGPSIKAQIFSAAGEKAGAEFLVNTNTVGNQFDPDVTGLAGGGFVVTWSVSPDVGSVGSVNAQIFSASGQKVGTEFVVDSLHELSRGESMPAITGLSNGGFVVTWFDGWDNIAVKAQVFSALGERIGSELQVSTESADADAHPTITVMPNGGFAIGWTDAAGTPVDEDPGTNIKVQVFSASGEKIGDELQVSTLGGIQGDPSITALSNGDLVVAWEDYGLNWDSNNIRAKILTLPDDAPTNAAPTNIKLSKTAVAEDTKIWTTLGLLSATDGDGDTLSYTLIDGAGDHFRLKGNRIVTSKEFDYETATSHTIKVAVSDGKTTVEKDIKIDVLDVTEAPVNRAPTDLKFSRTSLDENVKIGTSVGLFSALDPEGGTIKWRLLAEEDSSYFKIVGNKLQTKAAIDYEDTHSLTFAVEAYDSAGAATRHDFTLQVKDIAEPVLSIAYDDTGWLGL